VIEPIHAYLYFAPEVQAAWEAVGLEPRGQGYVVCRAAPMGAVGPQVAAATFFNFNPVLFQMALPAAWDHLTPQQALEARAQGIEAAFVGRLGVPTEGCEQAADLAREAVDGTSFHGRPLAAANAGVPGPGTPFGDLFQALAALREHRGDGHVALLTTSGLHPVDVLAVYAAWQGAVSRRFLQASRLWDDEAWAAAEDRVRAKGWMDADGGLTDAGAAWRDDIEARTDDLAAAPYAHLGEERSLRLFDLLLPICEAMNEAGAYKRAITVPGRPA